MMRLFKCTWIMLLIVNAMAIVSYASMPAPSAGDDGGKGRRVTGAKVPSDAVVLVQAFAKRQVQYGAGVIVHNSGYVATDLSIVKRAGAVVVYTMSGLMFDAWVIEGDVATGIALLKMPTKGLPTAKLSTQTTFKRNAKVYAVGFPQVHQLSAGRPLRPQLISGTIRATRMVASGGERAMAIETDIDISKSSPGAGLYDGAGQLIGIIVTHGRVLSGISFASPAGQLLKLMKRVGVSITPAPSQPSRRRIDTAVALGYLINGRVALEMRKMRRAKELFERALSGAPASAHYGLGMVYARQGQARRAISHLREATLLARNHGNAHELLGRVYMQAGNYPLAILHLKRALSIDPNYAGALGSIANAYHAQRRYKDALKFYQQALRILPDDLNLRTGLAQCYVALKRYKDAEREFLRILQRDPTLSGIHLNLAEIYEAMNRMDDAVTQYKLAVKYAPTDPMARLRLGMLYYQLGEIPNAINML
ncbi:MAG TPA: serine protease, partial [Armatimonadetes bacterium]|nr:serine protease [Armatimonadota bacterium]